MSTPIVVAAPLLVAAGVLAGWPEPESAGTEARQLDCRTRHAGVPAEYLMYHALVSPNGALGLPAPDTSCAASTRKVRT